MAFDLYFFKNKEDKIELNEVVDYFKTKENFSTKGRDVDDYSFVYENKKTNVTFVINYNEKEELITDLQYDENYVFCFTSFTISYIRPSFFALEAMPIVEEFSKKFNLYINDIQSLTEEKNVLKLYSSEELINSYNANNEIACIEFNTQFKLTSTTKEKSLYAYNYNKNIEHIESLFEDEVVPEISFIKDDITNKIYSIVSWSDATPTIIPKCDYIFIIRKHKSFIFKKQMTSLIEYDTILSTFKDLLITTQSNIGELLLLPKVNFENAHELFYRLDLNSHENFQYVNLNEVVDVIL